MELKILFVSSLQLVKLGERWLFFLFDSGFFNTVSKVGMSVGGGVVDLLTLWAGSCTDIVDFTIISEGKPKGLGIYTK